MIEVREVLRRFGAAQSKRQIGRETGMEGLGAWETDTTRALELWDRVHAAPGGVLVESPEIEQLRPICSIRQETPRCPTGVSVSSTTAPAQAAAIRTRTTCWACSRMLPWPGSPQLFGKAMKAVHPDTSGGASARLSRAVLDAYKTILAARAAQEG